MKSFKVNRYLVAALALGIIVGDVEIAGQQAGIGFFKVLSDAEARVGRPATPGSVAGVARRTTRRTIRRGTRRPPILEKWDPCRRENL